MEAALRLEELAEKILDRDAYLQTRKSLCQRIL